MLPPANFPPEMVAAAGVQATAMDDESKKEIALWRVAVLGPLISARLEHGDRRALLEAAATRTHQRPDGSHVRVSARTLEG
jgi:hypothetical protein